jgi:RNA recognition motif-containing protein
LKSDFRERLGSCIRANHLFYMKLFVGNLSFNTTEAELEELFAPFGTVAEATVIPEHRAFAGLRLCNAEQVLLKLKR